VKKTPLSQAAPTPKPDVLFVDDEQVVLDGIRRALVEKDVDWEVAFFDDPQAVLDAPQAMSCKVIVTDLRMSDMNGLELLGQLRAKGMEAEAIILTGTGDMVSALEAINSLRVFRYYTKPCPSSRLIEGIAAAIRQREGAAVQSVVADRLPAAVLALDAAKRIGFMNKEGAELVVAAGAVLFADAAGRCRASTPQQTALLHRSIDKVLAEGEPAVLVMLDAAGERQYSILVDRDDNGRADSVLLFVRDIHRYPIPSVDSLRQLFDFSGSEARLARELAAGFDLKEAAKRVGISMQTARTYLKILFGKTRTRRQAELVRLLVTAMQPMLSDGTDSSAGNS
jgi:FixJ family two-component response regulator